MADPFKKIQTYCLAKPEAFEDYPWEEVVWKVKPKDKIFCFGGCPPMTKMTVRATMDEQAALTQLLGIIPAPYLARYGWVSVDLTIEQNVEIAFDLIDRSYELVTAKTKKKG